MHVNSIFESISGEVGGFSQGSRCVFIRLMGCNLRCPYCDTKETQKLTGSAIYAVNEIFDRLLDYNLKDILITGGEPLLQAEELEQLCLMLLDAGKRISIETNGTIPIPEQLLKLENIFFVMDWKMPEIYASGFKLVTANKLEIFKQLRPQDIVKFVVSDNDTLAKAIMIQKRLQDREFVKAKFAYSPAVTGDISNFLKYPEPLCKFQTMAANIVEAFKIHDVEAILNLQIHKILSIP